MGVILRAPNTDHLIRGKAKTYISTSAASASGTLTVESIATFADNDFLIIGNLGEERTEIVQINGTPSGTTLTLQANTVHRHEKGTPVYLTNYNQIDFYQGATNVGSASTTLTATTPFALQVDQMDTIYDDTSNTTGFGFYRWYNSETTTYGSYSDAIPYAGYDLDAASNIFERALSVAGEVVNPNLRYEDLYKFLNDYVAFANSKNTRWSECKVLDTELTVVAAGVWEVSMPSNISKNTDPSAIINLRMSGSRPLRYLTKREWNLHTTNLVYSQLSSALAAIDTTAVLDTSDAFADSGSVMIKGDSIAYTGNTRSTETLTGVTGIVAAGHSIDDYVFQNHSTGIPIFYTVFNNAIRMWPIPDSTVANEVLYIDYYRRVPTVNSVGDKILLTNIQSAIDYVSYRIKKHAAGGTLQLTDEDYQQFLTFMKELVDRDTTGEPLRVRIS